VLDACMARIKALQLASGLEEAINQVESGEVARMREEFGPNGRNKGGKPHWKQLKGTINKRERIHKQLVEEFGNDKVKFFGFFVDPQQGKRKRTNVEGKVQLRPSNKVAEAIPHRDKDLKAAKASREYVDESTGCFSQDLWDSKWAGFNQWEIWRALGLERY
jgi:hypothetical protein